MILGVLGAVVAVGGAAIFFIVTISRRRHKRALTKVVDDELGWNVDFSEIHLLSKLGAGSFGEVHKASFRGTVVAVKQLRVAVLADEAIQNFRQEARVMRLVAILLY